MSADQPQQLQQVADQQPQQVHQVVNQTSQSAQQWIWWDTP